MNPVMPTALSFSDDFTSMTLTLSPSGMRNCQYPHTLSALIQAAESPERNLFPRREFDVVNSERGTGEVFTAYLRPVLSLSAHFDDGLLVYPED